MKKTTRLIVAILIGWVLSQESMARSARHAEKVSSAAHSKAYCSNKTLKGTYLYQNQGSLSSGAGSYAEAGMESYDGEGHIVSQGSANGTATQEIFTGAYIVNPDCSGTLTYEGESSTTVYNIYVRPDGSLFDYIDTTPGYVGAGEEKRITRKLILK